MAQKTVRSIDCMTATISLPDFNFDYTLQNTVLFQGVGIHSGTEATLSIHPRAQAGLLLRHQGKDYPLDVSQVQQTHYCTAIGPVQTLEHVLAALYGLGISAAVLEVNGPEMPILDGSSLPFVDAILQVGIQALPSERRFIRIQQAWQWQDGPIQIQVQPSERLEIHYQIDYLRSGCHLQQTYDFMYSPQAFIDQIAAARTFSFESDVPKMQAAGLIKGGSLDNALVLTDKGASLNSLRFEDEPVRHKILDCLGDLALLGASLQAQIQIQYGGHTAHVTMVKSLLAQA